MEFISEKLEPFLYPGTLSQGDTTSHKVQLSSTFIGCEYGESCVWKLGLHSAVSASLQTNIRNILVHTVLDVIQKGNLIEMSVNLFIRMSLGMKAEIVTLDQNWLD